MGPAEDITAHQKFLKKRKENHSPEWKTDIAGTRKTSSSFTTEPQDSRTLRDGCTQAVPPSISSNHKPLKRGNG